MSARLPGRNWLAAPLAVALVLLLTAVVRRPVPPWDLPQDGQAAAPAGPFRPAAELRRLSGPPAALPGTTNRTGPSPFYTQAIRPPPGPVVPPPPTTRKVMLLYQGHMETSRGVRMALVKLGEDPGRLFRAGDEVAGGFLTANIGPAALILTNAAGQQVLLPFRVAQEVEVPLP